MAVEGTLLESHVFGYLVGIWTHVELNLKFAEICWAANLVCRPNDLVILIDLDVGHAERE